MKPAAVFLPSPHFHRLGAACCLDYITAQFIQQITFRFGINDSAAPLEFYENGRPKHMVLARSYTVQGKRCERGTLPQFDREGQLTYAPAASEVVPMK